MWIVNEFWPAFEHAHRHAAWSTARRPKSPSVRLHHRPLPA